MLDAIARLVVRHPWPVIVGFVVVAVGSLIYGLRVHNDLSAGGLEAFASDSVQAREELAERFGVAQPHLLVVYGDEERPAADVDLAATLGPLVERLRADPAVADVRSPVEDPATLVSDNGRYALLTVTLASREPAEHGADLHRLEPLLRDVPLPTRIGGSTAAEATAQELAMRDLERAELVALPIAAVLLLIFFRGPVAAALPLAVAAFAIPVTLAVLRVVAHFANVSVFALNVATFIGTGLSIDYALVLVQRYRDEIAVGLTPAEAVGRMLRTSGKAIVVSGLAVATSLLALLVFPLVLLRSVGAVGALVVLCAMAGALVMLPALLVVLSRFVGPSSERRVRGEGGWHRFAMAVMKRPVLITVAVVAGLALLAAPVLRLQTITPDVSSFPRFTDVRQVDELIEADDGFHQIETRVLLLVRTEGEVLAPGNAAAVARYVDELRAVPGVVRVETPFGAPPLDDPAMSAALLAAPDQLPAPLRAALDATTDADATVVSVVGDMRWRSREAVDFVRALREVAEPGVAAMLTGPTAVMMDARSALADHVGLAVGLIVLLNFVVLFLAFGSIVVPIKAVLMNVCSIGASFGALVWIFQEGHFVRLLDFEPPGGIDLTVPIIMFAVVFGLSMDYEVFLLARIKEEYDRTRDNALSVAIGLERTASIITRAAAVLIVVVIGFALGRFLFVQELGTGMAVAIAIDATVVRALLVPATMELLGDANWWAPPALKRLWERLGLEVRESEA